MGQYRRTLARTTLPGVAVLGYHGLRADDLPAGSMAFENLHVRASTFDAHCRVVRECCDPITLDDWRQAAAGRTALPPRPVLITFDDGYRSVARIGAPILAAHQLSAVVFVCSDPILRRRLLWFDAVAARDGEAAVERWKACDYDSWSAACADSAPVDDDDPRAPMTVDEVIALSRSGRVEIGGHTTRHPILARASRERQREEIAEQLRGHPALDRASGSRVRLPERPSGRRLRRHDGGSARGARHRRRLHDASLVRAGRRARARAVEISDAGRNVSGAELAHRLAHTWPR